MKYRGLFAALAVALLAVSARSMEGAVTAQSDITLPTYQGYISVAPGGRYFVDEAGQGFIVIGQNDGTPWPGLATLLNGVSPEATENYIIDLRAHGITVSRVMIEYSQAPHSYLENPVGTFNPTVVAFWDQFIAMAEKHGLYLLLTPYDTFWQAKNWGAYPYSGALGGPCPTMSDWLTGEACIEAQKNRWRFIIDHWGRSPNVFAWDLMNEIDIWWNASPQEIDAYVSDMAAFVRDYETEKWGRAHMISVSSAAGVPDGRLGRVIFNHPALDFANTHLYLGPEIKNPQDPIGAGPVMAGGVTLALQAIQYNRPYFDSESGPIDHWITDVTFDKIYHHNMSWAHLAAGGAGSGMRWPYTNPHWILPELRENLLGLARYASTVDWAHFTSRNINSRIKSDADGVIKIGCSDGQTALIWLLLDSRRADAGMLAGVQITVESVLADGRYTVEFWETYEGRILSTIPVEVENGSLTLTIPDPGVALADVALIVRPAS
jgi:hypothetical protein